MLDVLSLNTSVNPLSAHYRYLHECIVERHAPEDRGEDRGKGGFEALWYWLYRTKGLLWNLSLSKQVRATGEFPNDRRVEG